MSKLNSVMNTEVFFSDGNTKMGNVPSVSLPPVKTCHNCAECSKKCYAKRIYARLPVCKNQYDSNYELYKSDPKKYFEDINTVLKNSTFFRFHVSGDIPDAEYFEGMIKACRKNKHCKVLCFTKNYEVVNNFLKARRKLPVNLHLIFSIWDNTPYENPYKLPTAHVLYKDGHTTAKNPTHLCDGNCFKCFIHDKGCIGLERGESVVFKQH